jgi:hypothetical protein
MTPQTQKQLVGGIISKGSSGKWTSVSVCKIQAEVKFESALVQDISNLKANSWEQIFTRMITLSLLEKDHSDDHDVLLQKDHNDDHVFLTAAERSQ